MRDPTIAKNYAEALIELARKAGADNLEKWGELIDDVANAMQADRTLYVFLESPRVAAAEKNRVLAAALENQVPLGFLRFLQALVKNRRQMLSMWRKCRFRLRSNNPFGRLSSSCRNAAVICWSCFISRQKTQAMKKSART